METLNKRWLLPLFVIISFFSLYVIEFLKSPSPKKISIMTVIPILPSFIYNNEGVTLPFREDFFAIKNLDRSDSTRLIKFIAQYTCQVIDTIRLKNYEVYTIDYYEYSRYINDSTYHARDRPLWQLAEELNAFVYSITFERGELSQIGWIKTGNKESVRTIPITKKIKNIFRGCRSKT